MYWILWSGYLQTVQPFAEGLSFLKGQQVAVGDNEETALPLLILWFGSEGRAVQCAVLTCLEMSLRPCLALLSLPPPGS